MHRSRAARPGLRRHLAVAALAPAVLVALTACGGDKSLISVPGATAGPAGVSTSGPDGTTPGASPTASSNSGTDTGTQAPTGDAKGCPAGGAEVPAAAGTAEGGDLDGDGTADQVWLADQDEKRLLGVRTASGATFSTSFTSGSPLAATAVGNRLGDGTAIILLSTGRSAALYAVIGCRIVPTKNMTGEQYTFDLGVSGYGTGVGCPSAENKLYLAGYNTQPGDQDGVGLITRTRISLTRKGARADNGTVAELGQYAEDSPSYQIATGVGCGEAGIAAEPES